MRSEIIKNIAKQFGTPFYAFDACAFEKNYKELDDAYKRIYPNFQIAYSLKTNYTPAICSLVLSMNGYAEIVSYLEYKIARRCGFSPQNIIVNGPGKWDGMEEMLKDGAIVMIDNSQELDRAISIAQNWSDVVNIGFRLNFEIKPDKISRFGFDVNSDELSTCIKKARNSKNVRIVGLHYHQSGARSLQHWERRIVNIIKYADQLLEESEKKILDLGSGMFGHMEPSFADQFDQAIPSFTQYAEVVALKMKDRFGYLPEQDRPLLIVEPGTTIVANTMLYATTVISKKTIKDKNIAIVDGSVQQLGEIGKKKRLPIQIIADHKIEAKSVIDITGYTCLEDDVLYKDLKANIQEGDIISFGNAGAYTNVLKPPFIQVGCKMVSVDANDEFQIIKRTETVDDILASYIVR